MGYETLIVDQSGPIATITLNRPDARNALDFAMRRELLTALDEIEANPAARVVILTGAGGHFCAGGDVKNMRQRSTAAADITTPPRFTGAFSFSCRAAGSMQFCRGERGMCGMARNGSFPVSIWYITTPSE